jgi:hypothetical protein
MKKDKNCMRFRKSLVIRFLALLYAFPLWAHENRNLLSGKFSGADVQSFLMTGKSWVSYPAYTDRNGWDKLTREHKAALIATGGETTLLSMEGGKSNRLP